MWRFNNSNRKYINSKCVGTYYKAKRMASFIENVLVYIINESLKGK